MGVTKKSQTKTNNWKVSGISRKFPSYRNSLFISAESWLNGKRQDDEAEGLWRIGDMLYDFTTFIDQHPGGTFWLEQTKGIDITEPFESHHISHLPESMLKKFEIRKASKPRNYNFTMHEHGFYKTLKNRVREALKEVDDKPNRRTNLMHFGLLLSTLGFAIATARTDLLIFKLLAALALCWLCVAAHNYFHRRDNWQMYTFNLTLLNFSSWRISHALSHHVYTNSYLDLEISFFEPFLFWIPNSHLANKLQRILSVIIQPGIYAAIFLGSFVIRLISSILNRNELFWHDLIGFTLPTLMLSVSSLPVATVLGQWLLTNLLSSFIFGIIGLNAAHHDPKIYHDGDTNRQDRDWGLYQVDTTIDRKDIKGSDFMVLTHFGEHILHHLFPTLDHAVLPKLYPALLKTFEEFNVQLREINHLDHIVGQNLQLLRTDPNPLAPGL